MVELVVVVGAAVVVGDVVVGAAVVGAVVVLLAAADCELADEQPAPTIARANNAARVLLVLVVAGERMVTG